MNVTAQNPNAFKKKLPFLFVVVVLLFAALACGFLSSAAQTGIGAVLAFIVYLVFCVYMSQRAATSFIILSPLIFLRATEIYAGIPIEFGTYIEEITTYGAPTGSTGRLAAFYIFCFYVCSIVIEPFWARIKTDYLNRFSNLKINPYVFWGFTSVVLAGTAYMIFFGLTRGFPLLENYDRFNYARDNADLIYQQWMANRYLSAFFLGIFYASKKHRLLAMGMTGMILVTSVLFAEKFTSISLILILVAMPSALLYIARHRILPIRRIVMYPAIILALTLPLVFVVYGGLDDDKDAMQGLLTRMASQGELWHAVDARYASFAYVKYEVLARDMTTWVDLSKQDTQSMGTDIGLYYLMDHVAPADVTKGQVERGTGYVFSLFPYILMISGWVGLIVFGVLTHLIFVVLMLSVVYQFSKLNFINLILCSRLFVMMLSGGFVGGYLWFFFGLKTFIFFGIIFMIDAFMRIATVRQRSTPRLRPGPAVERPQRPN